MVACQSCGKAIYRFQCYLKKYKSFFCSKKCESVARRGENGPFYGRKHTPEALQRILRSAHAQPNRQEKRLIRLFDEHNLPLRFVGDGSLIIDGMNPDFVSTEDPCKLVELFGRYWHDTRGNIPIRKTEAGKVMAYENLGYKCVVVWEDESDDQILAKVLPLKEVVS